MAMKTLAKVFDGEERWRCLPSRGVSSRGKGGRVCEDEVASLSNTTMVLMGLWVRNFSLRLKKMESGKLGVVAIKVERNGRWQKPNGYKNLNF